MKLQLLFLEEGPTLYAGYGLTLPLVRWDGASWKGCQPAGPRNDGWAVRLTPREAERCFPGATTADRPEDITDWKDFSVQEAINLRPDMFDSYDSPNIRKSPEEIREYDESVMPEELNS